MSSPTLVGDFQLMYMFSQLAIASVDLGFLSFFFSDLPLSPTLSHTLLETLIVNALNFKFPTIPDKSSTFALTQLLQQTRKDDVVVVLNIHSIRS